MGYNNYTTCCSSSFVSVFVSTIRNDLSLIFFLFRTQIRLLLQKLRFQVKIGFFSVLRTQITVFIHFLEISDLLFEFVVFYFMIGHITVKFLLVPSCTSEVVSEYGPASFQCSMSYPYGRPLLLNEGH